MDPLVARAYELLAGQLGVVRSMLPPETRVIDAHTHLGLDDDGHALTPQEHLASMDASGVSGAFVFALNEPDRVPAYRAPNDRVLAWAADSPDRFWPFVRLSLDDEPLAEATRCLDRGARGIKLHPRAQAFRVNDSRLEAVFALAAERRIPVLIHAGRGLPPGMALELAHVAERHPDATLILAHLAIAEQGQIGRAACGQPNVYFDTSAWTPPDQAQLLSLVAPEQILWASDIPYGTQLSAQQLFLRALQATDAPADLVRGMMGETALGLIDGKRPATFSKPIGASRMELSYSQARVLTYLASATPLLWMGGIDAVGFLGLAESACRDDPDRLGETGEIIRCCEALWEHLAIDGRITPADLDPIWRLLNAAQAMAVFA